MAAAFDNDLANLLDTHQPRSVLVIGPDIPRAVCAYQTGHPKRIITHVSPAEIYRGLDGLPRYDFGVISNTLEHMDKADAGRLIARLRDLQTSRFFALIFVAAPQPGTTTGWAAEDLLAYGMTLAGQYVVDDKPAHLYKFDINDYKKTPDWLNPDHWANPELWDKYRW
jgi:hypothetical protein